MKKIFMVVLAFLLWNTAYTQKNLLKNVPGYGIFEGNVESLTPEILVSNKILSKEEGISEKLEIQSFQQSEEKNDINVLIEVTKYVTNPLDENPMASLFKTQRSLDRKLSLANIAFIDLEGDTEDAITKRDKGRTFCQVNIDPEEGSDYRVKQGGEKMKKKEFGMNIDAMFNYVNSLLKGNFHDAEAKWDFGKEFRHFYYAAAGNVYVKVEVYAHKTGPDKAPDARKIANDILRKLPQDKPFDGPTNVEVYPKFNPLADANERGLIPASDLLPAKIVYKTGKANTQAKFSLMMNSPGELRSDDGQKGKVITVTTDAKGDAVAWYHYTDTKELKAPLEVQVVAEVGDKSRKAFVNVGLGLAFDQLNEVPEQVYIYSPEKPYAFALSVKSLFFPQLNLVQYIYEAHESKIWGTKQIGVQLVCTWVNKPDGAPADEFYVGTTSILSTYQGNNTNFLSANRHPMQYYTKFSYPAVVLKSQGTHIYQVAGEIAVLDGSQTERPRISYMRETMARTDALIPLSADVPETWFKSFACCLASVDSEQKWFLLEAVKLIPTYGMLADVPATASSFVCGILNGDYEKSILDLASWLGGQYIDNLMEAEVFNKLNKTKQDAVLAAKASYIGTDTYKKKTELEQIRARQTELVGSM